MILVGAFTNIYLGLRKAKMKIMLSPFQKNSTKYNFFWKWGNNLLEEACYQRFLTALKYCSLLLSFSGRFLKQEISQSEIYVLS